MARGAKRARVRCAVVLVLVLGAMSVLSGCASGGGSATNDPALAAKVRTAAASTSYAAQVADVTAGSDGKVTIKLDSTGSASFGDKIMPQLIANAVLNDVPGVKQLTLTWSNGSPIGVYTAK